MKKIIVLLMSLLMTVSMVACADGFFGLNHSSSSGTESVQSGESSTSDSTNDTSENGGDGSENGGDGSENGGDIPDNITSGIVSGGDFNVGDNYND